MHKNEASQSNRSIIINKYTNAIREFDSKTVEQILEDNKELRKELLNGQFFSNILGEKTSSLLWLADSIADREYPLNVADQNHPSEKLQVLEILLKYNANVHETDADGLTALHLVCKRGRDEAAKILLTYKAEATAKNTNGDTPLHFAVCANPISLTVIELLLKHGAKLEEKNDKGQSPILHATFQQSIEHLLKKEAKPNSLDAQGKSLFERHVNLGYAGEFCSQDFYEKLLTTHKVPYKYVDKTGWTILHRLICKIVDTPVITNTSLIVSISTKINSDLVKALLGTNDSDFINTTDQHGFTAYDYLVMGLLYSPKHCNVESPKTNQSLSIVNYSHTTTTEDLLKSFKQCGIKLQLSPIVEQMKKLKEEAELRKKTNPQPSAPPMGTDTLLLVQGSRTLMAQLEHNKIANISSGTYLAQHEHNNKEEADKNSRTLLAMNEHSSGKIYYAVGNNIRVATSTNVGSFSLETKKKNTAQEVFNSFPKSGNIKLFDNINSANNYAKFIRKSQEKPAIFEVVIKDPTQCETITQEFQLSKEAFRLPVDIGKKYSESCIETSRENIEIISAKLDADKFSASENKKKPSETPSNCFTQ